MAFNFNPDNNGQLTGRLARDPKVFSNKDGSNSANLVVMVDRGYQDDQGNDVTDAVPVVGFVRAQTDFTKTPFANIHLGDLVRVNYAVRVGKPYEKNGETVYPGPELGVEFIKNLEPKSVTQARLSARVAKVEQENKALSAQAPAQAAQPVAAAAPAQAGPISDDEPPF